MNTPRRLRWAVPLTAVVLTASACGSGETGDAAAPDAGEAVCEEGADLSVWAFGATGLEPKMEAWAEENGATVEFKNGEFDPHHEQLLTALVSDAVPDVAVVEVSYSARFKASPEEFHDLRRWGAEDLAGDYLDWRWEHGVATDGTVIGIPTDVGGLALAYRTDLFAAAGLPTDPDEVAGLWSSWEEFLDVGEKYTSTTGQPFLDDAGVLFQTVVNQGEEKFYAEDGELIHEENDQVARAWELATDAATRGGAPGLSGDYAAFSPEWNTAMAQGAYAVQLAPSWMLGYIQGQAPDTAGKWDVTTLPEPGGNWGGSQLTIPQGAENPECAYRMITEVLSPESQFEVFQENGNLPSTPEVYETEEMQSLTSDFFSGAPTGQIYTDSVLSLKPLYEGPDERTIMREFGNGIDRVEKGQEDADEAWDSSLEQIRLAVD
ncbi:ABC transporter substrate-binding protein [Thalassiella azotivora]